MQERETRMRKIGRGKAVDTCQYLDRNGWTYMGVRRILQGLIIAMRPKVVVEIGIGKGFTMACIVLAAMNDTPNKPKQSKRLVGDKPMDVKIFAVDPNRVGQRLTVDDAISGNSKEMVKFIWKRGEDVKEDEIEIPIDILFIDGDHSYKSTKAIWEKWSRWMRPGGIVVMHDITITDRTLKNRPGETIGVWRVWEEIRYPKVVLVARPPGTGVVQIPFSKV